MDWELVFACYDDERHEDDERHDDDKMNDDDEMTIYHAT